MSKRKHLPAVTKAANLAGLAGQSLTGSALTALQHDAARVVAKLSTGSSDRSLQLVSTEGGFSALIKHGNSVFQFEDGKFAVSTHD